MAQLTADLRSTVQVAEVDSTDGQSWQHVQAWL